MDAVSDPANDRIVLMSSAQIGKSECLNNIIGFHIAQDPAPILVLQPTLEMAETWSKDRLSPMLRDTPVLKDKVADPRSRDSGNTMLHKKFLGGHVTAVGANSAASLASRPIRIVLADEVDRYPPSAGTEGDPLSLAIKRTATFWNRRIFMCSTPTIKGLSRIEAEFEKSDQRRYFVECPHCHEYQHMLWQQVKWPDGKPYEAMYHCIECGAAWNDVQRRMAVKNGEWRVTNPEGHIVGFHLNELYSPWSTPGEMALAFLEAKKSPETLKTWVNTSLGETWEADADGVDASDVSSRKEEWDEAPEGVFVVTCGVDVQDDRLEVERVGWGPGEESWSLDHQIIYGDPSTTQVWAELDDYLFTKTIRVDGFELPVRATCIDSGGHHTQTVYSFCKERHARRIYAIKGRADGPVWPKRSWTNNKARANVFMIGVNAAKDNIYARLKNDMPGPGYCHFPKWRDAVYFEQLTSEVVQTKYVKGFPTRVYVLPNGKRNEALDIRVYAYAALLSLNVRWGALLAADSQARLTVNHDRGSYEPEQTEPDTAAKKLNQQRFGSSGGWLSKGRRGGWL